METMIQRRIILISGMVQGIGFRPFVYQLATRHQLRGFVRNESGGLRIEVEGVKEALDRFMHLLQASPPPLSQISSVDCYDAAPKGEHQFQICHSEHSPDGQSLISADVGSCADCLRELFDPNNRRYLYPFINCTQCGPRFTIITGIPYDREQTTMGSFAMCQRCRTEYENPDDRRFHAQATACWDCGPQLFALDSRGKRSEDALVLAGRYLRAGKIVALKGLGGFHFACLAANEGAVAELRRRKRRDEKPFAIMARDVKGARALCIMSQEEEGLLLSAERPIVLLRRKVNDNVAPSVAPGNPYLGVMAPYTPIHHLLAHEMKGEPLVMTSGNSANEPIIFRDDEVAPKLGSVADLIVTHDRRIEFRCDDSVTAVGKNPILIRRSRGYAPASISLPMSCTLPALGVGGQLKATFALGRERHAVLSHHLGDLDDYRAWSEYQRSVEHYERLLGFTPEVLAHDLHPDYASTRYCMERKGDFQRVAVQHHHAHMASCMAEHGLRGPVIGVTFDGTGYGADGTVWGGEFLVGDYRDYLRVAHLRCVRMPGGERAVKEPWRMALAHLIDAGEQLEAAIKGIPSEAIEKVQRAMGKGLNSPLTSSCGRLFDAAAAILGLRLRVSYEGQAAMELEWLAMDAQPDRSYPFCLEEGLSIVVDTRPLFVGMIKDIRSGTQRATIARRLHSTIVTIIKAVCMRIRDKHAVDSVVLSGGVFMNRILLRESEEVLRDQGFKLYSHRIIPANDGGLSLGQVAIAAAQMN